MSGFTFSDLSVKIMVEVFATLRAGSKGGVHSHDITPEMVWSLCQVITPEWDIPERFHEVTSRIAFAVCMSEVFPLGSDMYQAWREHELFLLQSAANANR